MSNSLRAMQSFLQSQSSAMSQRRQRLWDSLGQDSRSLRTEKERSAAGNRITPTCQEKELQGQKEDEKKDTDLECELQLSPMDVDKVLVNGIEWTKDSILNRNKKMALFNAKCLVSDAKAQGTRDALGRSNSSKAQVDTYARTSSASRSP